MNKHCVDALGVEVRQQHISLHEKEASLGMLLHAHVTMQLHAAPAVPVPMQPIQPMHTLDGLKVKHEVPHLAIWRQGHLEAHRAVLHLLSILVLQRQCIVQCSVQMWGETNV